MEDKKVETTPTPKGLNTPQDIKKLISANELVDQFCIKNDIALYVTPFSFKNVSDGSIIIDKPKIQAKYTNG